MKQKQQNGYSILELLIAMVIMVLIILPSINGWLHYQQRIKLANVSHVLLAFFIQVQLQANRYNHVYVLNYYEQNGNGYIEASLNDPLKNNTVKFIQSLSPGVVEGFQPNSPIIFYGKRNMAAAGTITIKNRAGKIKFIVSTKGRIRRCSEQGTFSGIVAC